MPFVSPKKGLTAWVTKVSVGVGVGECLVCFRPDNRLRLETATLITVPLTLPFTE